MKDIVVYAVVISLEVLVVVLTAFLSCFLKADPTRSFVLALLLPVSGLTIADILTFVQMQLEILDEELLKWSIGMQMVFNNCSVLTFLVGSLVYLFTSALVVRNKSIPTTWPWYILVVLGSLGISIAEYFKDEMLNIPRYILHGSFCISAVAMIILMITIPFYAHVKGTVMRVNTTDQAVFNGKWRLFWAYLYLIIPSIRSIFVIIRAIMALTELAPGKTISIPKGSLFSTFAAFVDLAGVLFYLVPVYFFLPAYRSCLFFCYRSREMNPHFFFIKVASNQANQPGGITNRFKFLKFLQKKNAVNPDPEIIQSRLQVESFEKFDKTSIEGEANSRDEVRTIPSARERGMTPSPEPEVRPTLNPITSHHRLAPLNHADRRPSMEPVTVMGGGFMSHHHIAHHVPAKKVPLPPIGHLLASNAALSQALRSPRAMPPLQNFRRQSIPHPTMPR